MATQVVRVADLLDRALTLVEGGMQGHEAVDQVLDGIDLFQLLVVDGKEVTRLFRDGFLNKVNRIDSPSRGWMPLASLDVTGPKPVTITRVEKDGDGVPRAPTTIRVRFLDARYSVSRGNVLVRYMTKDDLREAGERLIAEGTGAIRKGTTLAVDTVKALDEYAVQTPEELPPDVLLDLETRFSGKE